MGFLTQNSYSEDRKLHTNKIGGILMAISLFTRFVIIVTIIVAITDTIVFYHLKRNGIQNIMNGNYILFVILVILITIIPIVINLWWWLVFKKR